MSFREFVKANMFDGDEAGTINMRVSVLLDDIQAFHTEFLQQPYETMLDNPTMIEVSPPL